MKLGFDHDKYTRMQSERIIRRIDEFGGKLYLELGGKLFDDFHASRVLPGFQPDSKVQMLLKMKDKEDAIPKGPGAIGKPLARSAERGALLFMETPADEGMRLRAHQRAFRSIRGCRPFSAENCPPDSFPGAPNPLDSFGAVPINNSWGIVRFLMECQAMLSALPDN